jgi:hypothetical protein
MKIITFLDKEEDLEALARFLSDERIVVERMYQHRWSAKESNKVCQRE